MADIFDIALGKALDSVGSGAAPASGSTDSSALFDALILQESGGRQLNKDNTPVTSKKGAIGIAQVMPTTAPEAARLAGLEWDEIKYRTDVEYNKALGRAYFNKQLEDFQDPAKALAAYNGGAGRLKTALATAEKSGSTDAWLQYMPKETQAYVAAILARTSGRAAGGTGRDFVTPTGQEYVGPGKARESATLADYGKEIAASAIQGVGSVLQAGGEVAAGVANAVTGTQNYEGKNVLTPAAEAIRDTMTEGGKQARAGANVEGSVSDIFTGDATLPGTFDSWMMMGANGLGSLITSVLPVAGQAGKVATLLKGAKAAELAGDAAKAAELMRAAQAASATSKAIGVGTGATMTGGAAAEDVRNSAAQAIAGMSHEQLMQAVPAYAQVFSETGDQDQARQAVVNSAARWAGTGAAIFGAIGGGFNAKIIEDLMVGKGISTILGNSAGSKAGRAAIGGVGGAVAEGGQETSEKVGQNVGENIALGRPATQDAMRNTAGDFLGGAIIGGPIGAGGGFVAKPSAPNPLQSVADQAQKPGSVLSRAVVATGAVEQAAAAAEAQAQAAAADPLSARAAAVDTDLNQEGMLDKIRGLGPDTGSEFLYAMGIARNPNLDPRMREKALAQVEQVLATAKSGTGFVMQNEKPKQPGTDLMVPPTTGTAVAPADLNGQFFDPNIIDAEAVRVDNMLPGPKALPGPQRGLTTQQPQEQSAPAQAPVAAPAAQQNVAQGNTPLDAARAVDQGVSGMAEIQAPRVDTPAGEGPAVLRKRKAVVQQLAENGFETVQRDGNSFWMVNTKTGQKFKLDGPADAQLARKAIRDRIDALANTAAASPKNDLLEPTEAQIAAGNYKKSDVIELNGMKIKIENPQGSIRRGTSPDGKAWETKMAHHYGEFQGTVGADGDKLDVFVGPRPDSSKVYVIDQVNQDGSFDEHKVMMGFTTEADARAGYLANYEPGWTGLGAMTEMSVDEFKTWAKSRAAKKPLSAAVAAGKPVENFTEEELADGNFFEVNNDGTKRKLREVPVGEMPEKQSSKRSGKTRELTQDDALLLQKVAGLLGKRVIFYDAGKERMSDGFVIQGYTDTIFVASKTTINPLAVLGHEFFHTLRETNPQAWKAVAFVVAKNVSDAKAFRAYRYSDEKAAERGDKKLSGKVAGELEELVSDLGGNLLKDSKFWGEVFDKINEENGAEAKSIIAKLSAQIQAVLSKIVKAINQRGYRSEAFVKDLDQVRAAFVDAMAQHMKDKGITQRAMAAEKLRAEQKIKKSEDRPEGLTVTGYHFSKEPRQTLSTGFYGTGLKGSARDEIMASPDKRLRERLSFYFDKGTGVRPEAGVGGIAHKAELTNIYDADADPLKLKGGNARAFETKVLDAGYNGYLTRLEGAQPGQVILLGKQTIKPEILGPLSRIEGNEQPVTTEAAAEPVKKGLVSKELDAINVDAIPGATLRNGTLTVPADSVEQANAEFERIGSNIRMSPDREENAGFPLADADGNPITLYHGTSNVGDEALDELRAGPGLLGEGIYLTSVPARASGYTQGENGHIYPVYAEINNPISIDAFMDRFGRGKANLRRASEIREQLIDEGYDGIIDRDGDRIWEAVAFNPYQVVSAFALPEGDIRKSVDRKLERENELEMSTRIPSAKPGKKAEIEDPIANLLISDFGSGEDQERWIESVSDLVTKYPNYREADSASTPAKKLERLIRQMKENLVWLHNKVPASTRQRSKLWYDGANAIANRMSKKYDMAEAQASGVLAVLSPQKDWFMNVSLAERVAQTVAEQQNFKWSSDMEKTAERIFGKAKYKEDVDAIRGKTLRELADDDYLSAMWVRVYDEAHNSRSFMVVSPEGDPIAVATAKTGKPAKVAWGGIGSIAKAISIMRDGSVENISNQLGRKHKVRNFYNNILVPNSKNGHVTIDTHAVAAALLRPLSGNSTEVMHNFGGAKNALKGLEGTYALYEEAYRRAAKELDLLPRELQSITWEAIRGMYRPGFKSQLKNVEAIDKIWNQFKKGRLSYEGARDWSLESAGRIDEPSWLGRDPGAYVEDESSFEPGDVSGDGVSGRGSEDAFVRADLDDSGAAEASILQSPDRDGGRLDSSRGGSQGAGTQDGAGRYEPLPGYAHGNIKGAAGPDRQLVQVAEKYARDNGIDLRRQSAYVEVDPERAARIAAAYEAMPHAPQDPKVQEAFDNLIRQTRAQYDALVDAGYEFTFFDAASDPYEGNPWNAMRDLRQNKRMAVYGTYDGYGTEGVTQGAIDNNPMLADTGLEWEDQNGELHPVLANDLFRAVHDAFGHGLEGAGFRAQGEENAWQAHVRMFTGSAVGAITSETRGQNSWLNYGPYGEKNRNAKLEDTVFADQKTGLMPDWTWREGRDGGDGGGPNGGIRQSPDRITDTPEFKRWFADSKVVDAEGNPLVVYHGTDSEFSTFMRNRSGKGKFFFSPSEEFASDYGEPMAVYLSVQNPFKFGHDSFNFNEYWNGLSDGDRRSIEYTAAQTLGKETASKSDVEELMNDNEWGLNEEDTLHDYLQSKGYDGAIVNEDGVDNYIAYKNTQIKSATGNNGEFNPNELSILKSVDRPQFYSQLQRAIEQVPQRLDNMSAVAWKQWLTANASKLGIKADEIEWSGIKDFLDLQGRNKLSKDDLVAYLDDSGVKVGEVVRGGAELVGNASIEEADDGTYRIVDEDGAQYGGDFESYDDARAVLNDMESSDTKYGQYTLPGGENYREVLITLPGDEEARNKRFREIADEMNGATPERYAELHAERSRLYEEHQTGYSSSHWDQKNILAHIRVNDRTDADGKRVLFVEEIQSDWGQEGKKKGFAVDINKVPDDFYAEPAPEHIRRTYAFVSRRKSEPEVVYSAGATEQEAINRGKEAWKELQPQNRGIGVPAAPFVTKTEGWLNLALKRVAMMAVEGGYDKVAFVNGEQSADRYDLSKQVDRIDYDDRTGNLVITDLDGRRPLTKDGVKPADLPEIVGKEVADRLMASPDTSTGFRYTLQGNGLKVGGEGMKTFYDKLVPQALNKLLPKLGGEKLGEVMIPLTTEQSTLDVVDEDGELILRTDYDSEAYTVSRQYPGSRVIKTPSVDSAPAQPGFDVTDKMRETVSQGVPLFSADRPYFDDMAELKVTANYNLGDLLKTSKKLSWWDRTIGTQYNLAQKHPQFKRVFDAVQRFINDVSTYATRAADLAPTILPKLESWKDIARTPLSAEDVKALRDPIFGGTLKYTRDDEGNIVETEDVDKAGVVFTNDELRELFNLNDRQIGLYREFRRATNKSLSDLAVSDMLRYLGTDSEGARQQALDAKNLDGALNALVAHLDKLIEQQPTRAKVLEDSKRAIKEKAGQAIGLMARGYAPLSRFGEYTVYAVGKDGEQLYFSMFENERDANKMAREMQEQYPEATVTQGTMSQESYKLFSGVTPETLALFGESLGLEESGTDAKSEAFQQYLKMAKTNRSAMKRLIERKGIDGFSEDVGRVLAGFVYSNARQTSTNLHAGEIGRSVQAIDQRDGDVKDAAVRLMEYVQNPREEAQAIRGLLFTQFIGGSIASAMVNLTQPFTMTLPYLSQFGGAAGAAKRMGEAVKMASRGIRNDDELAAALKRAEEEGIVSPQEVHQLMAQAQGKGQLQSGDGTKAGDAAAKINNAMSKLKLGWGKVFSAAEQFNRRVTFIAAYKLARDQGMADPMAFAEKAIAETQGVYNKGNKPTWARGAVGGTLFTFKQYSIGYVEFLRRMWGNGPEGKKAVGLALAVLFLASGLTGMPGADDLDDVIDGFMQRVLGRSFDSKQAKREFFASILGQAGAEFVMSGLSGLPGVPIDISGRMGLGNLVPGTGLLTKKRDYGRDYLEILGPAGTFFTNIGTGVASIAQGEFGKAAESVAPVAAQNWIKAADMATMGFYRDQKGRKVVDTDAYDAFAKALGFQPKAVAQVQEATGAQQNLITQNKLRETEIADKWARGRIEKKPDLIEEAKQELADWNRNNPESRISIDAGQINKRVQEANKSKAQRVAATAPKEIRAAVKKELERVD